MNARVEKSQRVKFMLSFTKRLVVWYHTPMSDGRSKTKNVHILLYIQHRLIRLAKPLDCTNMNLLTLVFKLRPSAKLNPLWFGKFKIILIARPSAVSYTLQLPTDCNIHDTFHVSRLKPATDEMFSNRADAVLPTPAESGIGNVYEVEALLDHDFKYKVLY